MKLDKKYFLAIFTALGFNTVFGVGAVNAAACDNEISRAYQVNKDISPSYWFHWVTDEAKTTASSSELNIDTKTLQGFRENLFTSAKYVSVLPKDTSKSCAQLHSIIASEVISNIQSIKRGENNGYYMGPEGDSALICVSQYLAGSNCDFTALSKGGSNQRTNSSSNQSSSSSSSSQSNNQANRQSSSNLSDESKKKLNEAIDVFNKAHSQNDYANALPALKIIVANTQDKQLKASATNRLGEYYKFGYGVPKDEVKAQDLFEQASMDGETEADAQICHNYLNGIGVTENHVTAIKYCTTAANSGHVIAMAQLGWIYATGTGTQNEQLAKEWTCKAAQKGHAGSIKNAKILNLNCN